MTYWAYQVYVKQKIFYIRMKKAIKKIINENITNSDRYVPVTFLISSGHSYVRKYTYIRSPSPLKVAD